MSQPVQRQVDHSQAFGSFQDYTRWLQQITTLGAGGVINFLYIDQEWQKYYRDAAAHGAHPTPQAFSGVKLAAIVTAYSQQSATQPHSPLPFVSNVGDAASQALHARAPPPPPKSPSPLIALSPVRPPAPHADAAGQDDIGRLGEHEQVLDVDVQESHGPRSLLRQDISTLETHIAKKPRPIPDAPIIVPFVAPPSPADSDASGAEHPPPPIVEVGFQTGLSQTPLQLQEEALFQAVQNGQPFDQVQTPETSMIDAKADNGIYHAQVVGRDEEDDDAKFEFSSICDPRIGEVALDFSLQERKDEPDKDEEYEIDDVHMDGVPQGRRFRGRVTSPVKVPPKKHLAPKNSSSKVIGKLRPFAANYS